MITLNLYDRPAEGTGFRAIIQDFTSWRRTKRAIGGHYLGTLTIKDRGMSELTDFYNTWMGFKIIENTFGIKSYEGIIWQLDLIKNGVNYRRTLNPKVWHDRVKVFYRDANGDQQTAAWSENTDASGIYGEMEYVYILGGTVSTSATALRDRALVEYAWPISRTVGAVDVDKTTPSLASDGLYITTAGFWTTMNWQYYESDTSDTADDLVTTLVGATEFVSAGRIETNALATRVECATIPERIGDLITGIIGQGDSSGNVWKGGTYSGQEFHYEQVPTTVDYILRNGMLLNQAGAIVNPTLLDPGFYVRDTNAPAGYQPPGTSNIWDDPQVSYCDELEFIWPNMLKLKFPGQSQSVEILYDQIRGYRFPEVPDYIPPPYYVPPYFQAPQHPGKKGKPHTRR